MTIKEEFLALKTYNEYQEKKPYFQKNNLNFEDKEVIEHIYYLNKKDIEESGSVPYVFEKDGIVYELPHDRDGNWPPNLKRM